MQIRVISLLITLLLISCKDGSDLPKSTPSSLSLPKNNISKNNNEPSLEVKHDASSVGNSTDTRKPTAPTPSANDLITKLSSGRVVRAIPISKRSLSLKVWLDNGVKAVFKPMLKHNRRAVHEVAVFKLASHLNVRIVPPSTMRSVPLHRLVHLIKKQSPEVAEKLEQTALTDTRGTISGAMIHWVDNLDANQLKAMGGSSTLIKPLASIAPSDNELPLAEEASKMIVFDYVTGNWDRFSGGNLFVTPDGAELVLIDNNSTFAPWSKRQKNKMVRLLRQTMRFSAPLIEALNMLQTKDMKHIRSKTQSGTTQALLSSDEVELLFHRRDTVLSHVEQLIKEHGRQKILAFP